MYYTIRIQRKTDGTEVRNITAHDTLDDGEVRFHSCLASDINNADINSCMAMLIDRNGALLMVRAWEGGESNAVD